MAATVPCCNVTEAFRRQLNTLCIKEFPCGYGTWRTSNVTPKRSSKGKTTAKSTSQAVPVIIPGSSAQSETAESLQELTLKTPYNADCSWSNEAKSLRQVAVTTPDKVTEAFVLKFFKSLRIVDKKVTEIDEGLLLLKNLKQLTLSANLIKHVDSKRLPKGLQELELAANEIVDISPLCMCPPPLSHLGLGYNRLSSIAGKMKASSWPQLLSLDLSFNNLSELCNTVNVLKALPKLKNLVLQGNPFALVPGYRGYTIDSIRQLTILDDMRISADEKHFFKGLSKLKDVPVDEAQFEISVKAIKGVRMPEEIKDPEINADYPKTEHKYHVEFQFLIGASSEVTQDSPAFSLPTISVVVDSGDDQEESPRSTGNTITSGLLQTVTTESLSWAEEAIECNFSQKFHTRLLVALRDFIQGGIDFTVVETKHMYVLENPNTLQQTSEIKHTPSAKSRPGSKMQKGQEKRKESAKGKEKEKAKDGKAKKSKQEDIVLFELPRKTFAMGSCHVPLSQLLEGEFEVETECICESGEETGNNTNNKREGTGANTDGSDKKKGTKDSAGDKHSKGSVSTSSPAKGKGGRGKSGKPEDKKVKEREKHEESNEDEEITTPPPPLSIQVHMKLVHWKSAREAQQNIPPHAMPSQAEQNDTPTLLL